MLVCATDRLGRLGEFEAMARRDGWVVSEVGLPCGEAEAGEEATPHASTASGDGAPRPRLLELSLPEDRESP